MVSGFGANGGQLAAPHCPSTHDEAPEATPPETEHAAHTVDAPESGWRRKRGPRKRRVPLCTDQSWHLGNHFWVRPVSILGWKFKLVILHMYLVLFCLFCALSSEFGIFICY